MIHNLNFRRAMPDTCHAKDEFAELLNDKGCNWNFQNRVYVMFG